MARRWDLVYLWGYFQMLHVVAFNLDSQNVLQRSGDPGSLFGFSITFHQQLNPTRKNLLLVGAPRSKQENQVNVTGVVYQCGLSAASERCQPIQFNHEEFLNSQGINGQWMGVRVTSQGPGKNVMTCAHRYQQWSPSPSLYIPHLVTGQCYLLDEDLQVGTEERTWRRVVCDSQHLISRPKDQDWFAYCQQGHGAAFAKDNRSVVFGAPGAYQWRGIVQMEPLDNLDIYSEDARETGDSDQFNSKLIPLQRSSYLGFSVDSGMALIRRGELTIVSGAPRGGYSGKVAFLKPDPLAKRNLSVEFLLAGPGLASSFGYDVAVVDLNGDGWDDLAVGAPQFFRKDDEVGGAVYIYVNNKGANWERTEPVELYGRKESMFGLAVENIGDINQDGYGDLAVGAPYERSGRVYIYCGSSDGINKKPAQILKPESKMVSLFGYSLSGNLDVDDNQYPDVAVGSLSDSVFVYRARPVVSVSISLKLTPHTADITEGHCENCYFAAKTCFSYTAHPATYNPKLVLSYTFEADAEKRKARLPPRVDFQAPHRGQLELPGQRTENCAHTRLRLLRDISDKLQPIPVSVTMSLWSPDQSSADTHQPELPPVLSLYQQNSAVSEITLINKGCGSDNICQSNLALQYKFCSVQKRNNKEVFTSLTREGGAAVITPSEEDIALEITATNRNGDDAHQTHLVIALPETLPYSSSVYSTASTTQVSCTANDKGTLVDCELGNPLQRDAEVTFYVKLTTSGISLSTKDVNVTLQLKTTSEQSIEPVEALARVVFELDLQLHGLAKPSQVYIGEKSEKGESAINSVAEIGAEVQYEFKITNMGSPLKSFANASLNIYWPKENHEGKRLLYLTQISSRGVQSIPCSPGDEVHPLQHVKGWSHAQRRRREADGEYEALSTDGIPFLSRRKHKTLTCRDGLKCVEVRCPLLGLDSSAGMVLHSRLWNATLTQDYSSFNYLIITVDAILSLTNSPENIGLKSEKSVTKVNLTVFLEKETQFYTKVAWWIIFLTVIVLLLLLAFLGYMLWKHGCPRCYPPNKKLPHEAPNAETAHLKA